MYEGLLVCHGLYQRAIVDGLTAAAAMLDHR